MIKMMMSRLVMGVLIATMPMAAQATPLRNARTSLSLNEGWRFHLGALGDSATQPDFDDHDWSSVSVPHSWNRIGEYRTTRSPEANNVQGIGYYRRHLVGPAQLAGKRVYLQFDAVANIADVWLNGVHIGTHRGAFSRFRLDVTQQLRAARDNVLVVRADNSKPALGSSTQDIIPLGGDFFIFGGIYRGVSLIVAPDAGVDLGDHGGPGVYAHAAHIDATAATIAVDAKLVNAGSSAQRTQGEVRILDASGHAVAQGRFDAPLAAHTSATKHLDLKLVSPHLWNGRADPYLYHVSVAVAGAHGRDEVVEPLGVRSFRVDANEGFFLNGAHLDLHGASRHQDRPGKGWALSPEDHAEDMAIMADMGANTVRMAHYQHAPEWLDAADKTGMVAWAEIPFVNAASFGDDEGTPALHDNAREQLIELIRQNYNHPSVMFWSVGNEVDIGASFGRGKPAHSRALLAELNALAHQEDTTRLTTFADCCEETNSLPNGQQPEMLAGTTDVMGYNRYYGWYYDAPAKLGKMLDHFHAKHPTVPLSVSEYGAGGALTQHSDDLTGAPIRAWGRPHPEEFQDYYHEESWKQLKARHYLFANWIWNMFDFSSDLRQEGDAIDLNDKGVVTYDRKTRKDAFYFYRANWSDKPTLHLVGRRYAERAYVLNDIKAYSNADAVTLSIDGQQIAAQPCPDRICVWPQITLHAGANHIVGTAMIHGVAVRDEMTLSGPDPRAGVRIDVGNLGAHVNADGARFGSDHFGLGGTVKMLNGPRFGTNRSAATRGVIGATDPALYDDWREGSLTYAVPVPNGAWMVVVHSLEPDATKAATRTFSVLANGEMKVQAFNPAQAAGGVLKATQLRFPVTVTDGAVRLSFDGDAVVAAIEIVPSK